MNEDKFVGGKEEAEAMLKLLGEKTNKPKKEEKPRPTSLKEKYGKK